MNILSRTFLFSCRKATLLTEKKLSSKISFVSEVRLRVHTAICKSCRNYQIQCEKIEETLKKNFMENNLETFENESLKRKIIDSLPKE